MDFQTIICAVALIAIVIKTTYVLNKVSPNKKNS